MRLLTYPVESSLFTFYLELIKFNVNQISYPQQGMVTAGNLSLTNVNQHLLKYLVESRIVIDVPVKETVEPQPA